MKKTTLMIAALALSTIFGGFVSAQAATCASGDPVGRTKADPFGSCENASGAVTCGTGTNGGGVFTLIVINDTRTGVQGCSDGSDALPVKGRVSVYRDAANNVAVGIDGCDSNSACPTNSGGAAGWQRYDVRPKSSAPTSTALCARRASGGTWYTGASGGMGATAPNATNSGDVNQGIDGNGDRTPCGGNPIPA